MIRALRLSLELVAVAAFFTAILWLVLIVSALAAPQV